MKKYVLFFLLIPFLIFYSCRPGGSKSDVVDPDETMPGRKVMILNPDSTPKVVYYYPVDAQGNLIGKHNREIHYLPGKKKYVEGYVQDDKRNGEWKSYFEDGSTLKSIANYNDGQLDGSYKIFHENGKIWIDGQYKNGHCDGKWIYYDATGNITNEFTTDDNSIGCKNCPKCYGVIQGAS